MVPNVVLVIVDALRRDCLGAFNPGYRFTPGLDDRLAGWHRLERCYSSAPWTLPSVTTLLTGVSASHHGEFFHADPDSAAPRLPELLQPTHRRIGVVNNGNLTESRGFGRGFDEYTYTAAHDEPFALAREAIGRVQGATPYFLLLHTNLVHDYFRASTEECYTSCFPGRSDWFRLQPSVISWNGLSTTECRRVRSFYDACVHRMDSELGRVLDAIDLETTIVCIVADHGEGLDHELGRVHHGGRVHDDLVNVPALLHVPPSVHRRHHDRLRERATAPVWTADILPTLLDLAGCEAPDGIDGRSLVGDDDGPRTIVSEDRRFLYVRTLDRLNVNREGKHTTRGMRYRNNALQATAGRHHNVKAFIRSPHKLIVTSVAPPPALTRLLGPVVRALLPSAAIVVRRGNAWVALELFDLDADPGELHNLLDRRSPDRPLAVLDRTMDGLDDMEIVLGGTHRPLRDALGLPCSKRPAASDRAAPADEVPPIRQSA